MVEWVVLEVFRPETETLVSLVVGGSHVILRGVVREPIRSASINSLLPLWGLEGRPVHGLLLRLLLLHLEQLLELELLLQLLLHGHLLLLLLLEELSEQV